MQARRAQITREAVLAAALALVDREGLAALTMRRLGRELGIEAMSLYNHVRDKEDLLDGVVGLLSSEVEFPGEEHGDWAGRVAELIRRYRRLARLHPNAFPLIALRPLRTAEARRPVERALELAVTAGFTSEEARRLARVLASYANGFALNELSGGFDWPTDETEPPENLEEEFDDGLSVIIDGFRRRLPPTPRARARR